MFEIVIEPRRTFYLRQAVSESIKTGDYDSLYDDIRDCFTEEQVEDIEDLLDSGDIGEAIDEIVEDWNAEDLEELLEMVENYFASSSIEIQFVSNEDFEESEKIIDGDFDDELIAPDDDDFIEEEEEDPI
jgi:hypothetical protein